MEIRSNFHQAMEGLQRELLDMGDNVERLIHQAVDSLIKIDIELAQSIINEDDRIDAMALAIEQRSLNLIALQQPMATDLRVIGMAVKIVIDLERIADHAVDIAKITRRLQGQQLVKPLVDIPRMAIIAEEMLKESLIAYTDRDVHRAATLALKENEVDKLYNSVHDEITKLMGVDPNMNKQLAHLLMVAHYLERVADHATNIGEGVIYMVTGSRKDLNL